MTAHALPHEIENSYLPEDAREPIESLVERATDLEKAAREFIQTNPTVALAGALTIGFLVGRLVMR